MKKIMSAALALIMTLSLVMVGVPAAWADTPTETGKVFAGYYTDDTYTTPSNGETSYPKFVDEDVLKVKCQLTYLANEDDDSTRIRVVTTVDSTRYQKVGFFVSVDGGAEKEYATTKVARRIVGTDGLANLEYEPSVFSAESQYFCAYNFTVGSAKFGTALSFTPSPSLKSVQAILKSGQDRLPDEHTDESSAKPSQYSFTRGAEYYSRRDK